MIAVPTKISGTRPPDRALSAPEPACSLAEVLDRILHRGVALEGNVTISVADVDLLYLDLRLLLASIDTVWPEGRPHSTVSPKPGPAAAPPPQAPPMVPVGRPSQPGPGVGPGAGIERSAIGAGMTAPPPPSQAPATVAGLVRLVLTLVKVLHDVLERQAVRRMDAGHLTSEQIENVGAGLLAQALAIEQLSQHFGFADRDLALRFGLSDRSI